MDIVNILTISAIFLGPISAIRIEKWLEVSREKNNRKHLIFRTLMSSRFDKLSKLHVEALNLIDIEFYGEVSSIRGRRQTEKEKSVVRSWKTYKDHLNRKSEFSSATLWYNKSEEYFIDLIFDMSKELGYDFDKVQLGKECYKPEGHYHMENLQNQILTGIDQVVNNGRPLIVVNVEDVSHETPDPDVEK